MGLRRSIDHLVESRKDLRTFPYIEFLDFKKYEIEKLKFSVANIQIETPDSFLTKTKPPKLTAEAEKEQKRKIHRFLIEALEKKANLIVLPELSTSENICKEIKEKYSSSQSIMVLGSYYDDYSHNCSPILIDGKFYGQRKNNPAPEEKDYMRRSNDISIFINTPIGDFAVLICYDATDFSILSAIEDFTDFIICVARTKDVITFRNIFSALTYLQYQYVIFCNDAQYGGSSFFLPFHGNRMQDTLGQKNEGIIYRKFDLKKLDDMRASFKKDKTFKYPPASARPRHIPYVKREHRMKEYFESKSFNYLPYINSFEILKNFLAHMNISRSKAEVKNGSIFNLEDVILKSCGALYAPGIALSAMNLNPLVLKYFPLDLVELICEKDKSLLGQKRKKELAEELSNNLKGKQYILFEIDLDLIKKALLTIPEMIDEILRIFEIEREKKLREIPKELQIEKIPNISARAL